MMIPRRLTFGTYRFLGACAALVACFVLNARADEARERDYFEVVGRLTAVETSYWQCSLQRDRYDTILTQCLAWQGRLGLEMNELRTACLGDGGGAW